MHMVDFSLWVVFFAFLELLNLESFYLCIPNGYLDGFSQQVFSGSSS